MATGYPVKGSTNALKPSMMINCLLRCYRQQDVYSQHIRRKVGPHLIAHAPDTGGRTYSSVGVQQRLTGLEVDAVVDLLASPPGIGIGQRPDRPLVEGRLEAEGAAEFEDADQLGLVAVDADDLLVGNLVYPAGAEDAVLGDADDPLVEGRSPKILRRP